MHDEVIYKPGTPGLSDIHLDAGSLYVGPAPELRARRWSYTLTARSLKGLTRVAREATCTLSALSWSELDRAEMAFDADVAAKRPGILMDRGWSCRALVVKSDPSEIRPKLVQTSLTVVLLDGVWRRPTTTAFNPTQIPAAQWLDLPFDFPMDLGPSRLGAQISNPSLTPAKIRLVVYGPAVNPYIMIGGNRYQVDVPVPAGGYLTVDGVARTIELTSADGDRMDCFAQGRRGSGLHGGEYIFQPIPAGSSEISWPSSFGFDLTVYEERGEPPWI